MRTLLAATAVLLLVSNRQSHAGDPTQEPAFGQQGQVVLDADVRGRIEHATATLGAQSQSTTTIALAPGAMYFVSRNLALGGTLSYAFQHTDAGSISQLGIGPSVGYNLAFSETTSFFPRVVGLFVSEAHTPAGGDSSTGHLLSVGVSAPVLFHLAPHFFVGAGPYLTRVFESNIDGQDGPTATAYGLALFVGGWL